MSTLQEKMGLGKKQHGLASVEAVLIMPILWMLMYIMVQSAKTMVVYEQRTIESRNAAYTVELYSGGEVRWPDEKRKQADEALQGVENSLADAIEQANGFAEYLELVGIDAGQVGDHLDSEHLKIIQQFPIQRYATVSEESQWFYNSMLELTRDKQDEFSTTDDPDLITGNGDKIKNLYKVLDDERSKSGVTVGVSVSAYTGPLGVFAPFDGQFFMRNYHAADFATTLNLDDITINKDDVINNGEDSYILKAGYSKELKEMLQPEIIFNNLFPDPNNDTLEVPGIIDLHLPEPIEPTLGLQEQQTHIDADLRAFEDYRANGGTKSRANWELAGKPINGYVEQLSLKKASARARLRRSLIRAGHNGDGKAAHHIIPLEAIDKYPDLMLKAAEGGFDINGAAAGIFLGPTKHVGGHPQYNAKVLYELSNINANASPAKVAAAVRRVVTRWRNKITSGTDGPWK